MCIRDRNKAAQIAGFADIRFQFEPIGAAFAYEKTIQKKELLFCPQTYWLLITQMK